MESGQVITGPYPVSDLREAVRLWDTERVFPALTAAISGAVHGADDAAVVVVGMPSPRAARILDEIMTRRAASASSVRVRRTWCLPPGERPATCAACGRSVSPRHWYRSGQPRCQNSNRWWTPERIRLLDELLAQGRDDAAIARRLGCTPVAINQARKRYGLRARTWRTMTARAIARRLGMGCAKTVAWWVRQGWLHAQVVSGRGASGIQYLVTEANLRAFLADPAHWHRWDPDRIADPALRAWVREQRAGERFLGQTEVAALCGVQRGTVKQWIAKGWLPAVRNGRGNRRIREVDALRFREARLAGKVRP